MQKADGPDLGSVKLKNFQNNMSCRLLIILWLELIKFQGED